MKEISSKRFRVALLFVMPNGMMMGGRFGNLEAGIWAKKSSIWNVHAEG